MKYCKKCVMPDTRPGIVFNDDGVCMACINHENKKAVDWNARFEELEQLVSPYRKGDGEGYDCIIAVSGGKDSHYQTYIVKEVLKMNPLLVSVEDNFPMTDAGLHNIKNISEEFGCDIITIKPNIKLQKNLMRKTFERYGKPTWYIDRLIYTYPLHMAIKWDIPLVFYGENINYEYGGAQRKETYSAIEQVNNGVASEISYDELLDDEVTLNDLFLLNAPSKEEIAKVELNPVYLSYFVEWNSVNNYEFSKKRGFRDLTHEWQRTHHVEDFDQVDSRAYLIHPWMKYPKFGHASATDYASRFVRYGMLTRDEACDLVKKRDHDLDPLAIRDFCEFLGYSESEFWSIIDKFYNENLFEKDKNGKWTLKEPVWK